MAQDDCLGTWKNVKLGNDHDGSFVIRRVGSKLVGKHSDGTDLQDLSCDGETMSFFRVKGGETIFYKNGKITKVSPNEFTLKGKFAKTPGVTATKAKGRTASKAKAGSKKALNAPDDWTGEKTT